MSDLSSLSSAFSALSTAFEQYCDLLTNETDVGWVKWITNKLKTDLGNDACHLVRAIPKLAVLFD